MLKTIIPFCMLMASVSVYANLYQCDKPNGKLIPVDNKDVEIELKTQKANWFPTALGDELQYKEKIPFLIYYAIDTPEPFMKYSTEYETRRLKENCSKKKNFAILLNSKFINKNIIDVCKDGLLRTVNLSDYPKLNSALIEKRKFIGHGDHETNDLGPMRYLVKYKDITKKSFEAYPLAHPDFLYALINLLLEEATLFPSNEYLPLLNLKSHGSEQTVLSGIYSCQASAKTKSQDEFIEKTLTKKEQKALNSLANTNESVAHLNEIDQILEKLNLGTKAGLGRESNLDHESNLGKESSLGNAYFSLGFNEGLGTDLAFGLYHVALNAVLNDLFNKKNNRYLGFLMLESCDTNRDIGFNHANQDNIIGIYSAKYSLWYRNLNWWEIFAGPEISVTKLLEKIEDSTSKITNLKQKPDKQVNN